MSQHILVVDDEEDIRQLVAIILESDGYQVTQAANGDECLNALERLTCDALVLDIMMPKMDGWEICRRIKSHPRTKSLPVLILTIRSQPLDRVIGLEVVHADAYLTKPFERRELLDTMKRLLTPPALPS